MKVPVFHSYDRWRLSGVNTWTESLLQGLEGSTYEQKILLTGGGNDGAEELKARGLPFDTLPASAHSSRRREWMILRDFLEKQAPCIYLPNYDFHRAACVGILSRKVRVCSVLHSDEACYYDQISRLGKDCDAIVGVSARIEANLLIRFPHLTEKIHRVAYGIPQIQDEIFQSKRPSANQLCLAYCNRISHYQKRVFDLPPILFELRQANVPFHLTIAGDGPDVQALRERFDRAGLLPQVTFLGKISNRSVLELYRNSHACILTSDFEGLPISLLEAMSVGSVPVAYSCSSGIEEVIQNRENGLIVSHGDSRAMAEALRFLWSNPSFLRKTKKAALATISKRFSMEKMCKSYLSLFDQLMRENLQSSRSRSGKIVPPFELTLRGKLLRRWRALWK